MNPVANNTIQTRTSTCSQAILPAMWLLVALPQVKDNRNGLQTTHNRKPEVHQLPWSVAARPGTHQTRLLSTEILAPVVAQGLWNSIKVWS